MTSAPSTPPEGRKRKHRPMRVELRAALRFAGIDPDKPFEWQHSPPLAIRPFDPVTNDYDPPENDDRYIIPMQKADHAKVTKEVDRPQIDKTRRQSKGQAKHAAAMDIGPGPNIDFRELRGVFKDDSGLDDALAAVGKRKQNWPKGRKLQGRRFQKSNRRS